ncbi:MAG: TrmH family RNA methyltransferase [Spirochaetia bacterium]|nr:TrmH family RNA methyltransferase [Spirochaetia bacterium]
MIALRKLASLSPGHRRRKAATTLEALERSLRAGLPIDAAYAAALLELLAADEGLSPALRAELERDRAVLAATPEGRDAATGSVGAVLGAGAAPAIAALNRARRDLGAELDLPCADWDLLPPPGAEGRLAPDPAARRNRGGMRAYLEDLRSPFNVGAAFRSADAFGVEELLLSPFCADPLHPRALRSAMGAVGLVPWRRASLDDLGGLGTVFVLELGGADIEDFEFPERGVVILGSEELGASPEALARAEKRVSIQMHGVKGSLNAGVAFGILLHAWRRSLARA